MAHTSVSFGRTRGRLPCQPIHQMGRSAVNTLLALIAGIEPASLQVSLPTELVMRASTARVKNEP